MLNFLSTLLRQNRTIRELTRLSDRELADLGILRSDIKAVARSAAPRPASHGGLPQPIAPSWAVHNRRSLAA